MKLKFLSICPVIGLLLIGQNVSASEQINENYCFSTSDNNILNVDDVNISLNILSNHSFDGSQEVIDFLYYYSDSPTSISDLDNQYNIFNHKLTSDELILLISLPQYISIASNVSNDAMNTAKEVFPNNCADDSIGNAFQHFYWTLSLIVNTSESFGYDFVVAHENYDDNDPYSKSMDLENDFRAYSYYKTNESITYSKTYMISLGKNYVANGYLTYVLRDYQYVSQIIYDVYTKKETIYYETNTFFAYTNSTTPYNLPETKYYTTNSRPNGPTVRD